MKTQARTVSELGEFGLIERLREGLGDQAAVLARHGAPSPLLLGIGDDAAVWQGDSTAQIATTDTLVQGVHFPPGADWRDLGWKALAVNVSDVAALGGYPEYALVTLALPGDFLVEDALALYRGLAEAGGRFGGAIAGGDVVRASQAVISVSLIGRPSVDREGRPVFLRRDAARVGDVIAVTGTLGDAAGGLLLQLGEAGGEPVSRAFLLDRHRRPQPRLDVGQAAVRLGLRCAIDVSDGLAQDLGHVCRLSGVSARVRLAALPLSPALRSVFGERARELAAGGGEDYELLLAGPEQLIEDLAGVVETPIAVIGEVTDDAEHRPRLLDAAGAEVSLASAGWDHFAATRRP